MESLTVSIDSAARPVSCARCSAGDIGGGLRLGHADVHLGDVELRFFQIELAVEALFQPLRGNELGAARRLPPLR